MDSLKKCSIVAAIILHDLIEIAKALGMILLLGTSFPQNVYSTWRKTSELRRRFSLQNLASRNKILETMADVNLSCISCGKLKEVSFNYCKKWWLNLLMFGRRYSYVLWKVCRSSHFVLWSFQVWDQCHFVFERLQSCHGGRSWKN